MKGCSTSLAIKTTTPLSKWLKYKIVKIPNASEDAEKITHSLLVGM